MYDGACWQFRDNLFVISALDGFAVRRVRDGSSIFVKILFGGSSTTGKRLKQLIEKYLVIESSARREYRVLICLVGCLVTTALPLKDVFLR